METSIVGTVLHFNERRCFGFIAELTPARRPRQFFFHVSDTNPRFIPVADDIVVFKLGLNSKKPGQIIAVDIRLSKRDSPETEALLREASKAAL